MSCLNCKKETVLKAVLYYIIGGFSSENRDKYCFYKYFTTVFRVFYWLRVSFGAFLLIQEFLCHDTTFFGITFLSGMLEMYRVCILTSLENTFVIKSFELLLIKMAFLNVLWPCPIQWLHDRVPMAGRTSSELSKLVSSFQAPNSCGKSLQGLGREI